MRPCGSLFACMLASLCLLSGSAWAQVVTEFSAGISAGAGPAFITAGIDGNLWFTEQRGNRIARITRSGVVTEFSAGLTAGSLPAAITAGPDGNIWFTEIISSRVGRITPEGVITEFGAGITGVTHNGIVAGPDGNLWFTESLRLIGRITPLGVVTEFTPGITQNATYITAGPDGNLWFTETNFIGRITPTGSVTEFSAGISAGANLDAITTGPDGNLWFTEIIGDRIGRITPLGVVTEFSAGITAGALPRGITAGPDGNLWFTEQQGDRIGRITPLGVVTEFSAGISAGAAPGEITAGRDGNLWFGEFGDGIGRITTGAACFFPSEQNFSAASGFGFFSVNVGANCSGFATTTDGWIALLPGPFVPCPGPMLCPALQLPGRGVNFAVAKNTGTASRTGYILIGGNSFTVTQAGVSPVCTFSVSPASQQVSAGGGGTVTERVLASSSSCGWTATVNADSASAMRVADGAVGLGNGLVQLSVSTNPGTASRTLTATIAQRSISVLQSGSVLATVCGAIDVSTSVRQRLVASAGWIDDYGNTGWRETAYITNTTGSTLTNVYYVLHNLPEISSILDFNSGLISFLTGTTGDGTTCYGKYESMLSLGDIEPRQTVTVTVLLEGFGGYPSGITSTTLLSGRPNQ